MNIIKYGLIALFLIFLAGVPAHASPDPVADTRQIMAGSVGTPSAKAAYLSGARDGWTSFKGALGAYKAVRAAEMPPVVVPPPVPLPGAKPIMADDGDSLSILWGGNWTGIYAATRPDIDFRGFAVGGSGIDGVEARFATIAQLRPAWYMLDIGANDAYDLARFPTAQAYADRIFALAARARGVGARAIIGAIIAQTNPSAAYQSGFNQRAREINAILRTAVGKQIDAFIPFDSDPRLGTIAGMSNTANSSDGVHPNAAYPVMAAIAKPYIDAVVDQYL